MYLSLSSMLKLNPVLLEMAEVRFELVRPVLEVINLFWVALGPELPFLVCDG